ncbi:MAG TPA: SpoIIE family protein phosphatase [Burkholderiales bacterium]
MHKPRGPERRRASGATPLPPEGERRGAPGEPHGGQGDRRRHGFISQLQLFSALPYDAIERLLDQCDIREHAANAVLLAPGQVNQALHLLISGRLRIHFDSHDSADFIGVEPGACFGELSVIDGQPVSAWVVTDLPSRILTVPEHLFWDELVTHPGVARNLLRELAERMRRNRDLILDRVKDRLALAHLQKELSIAHDIQLAMLPNAGELTRDEPRVDVHAMMEPAKNVGGDFYDVFYAAPGRLLVAVGDVSGKGVPASLFMARTITQLRAAATRLRSPAGVLEATNRALCQGNEAGMFVTLFCGILDLASGDFSYANAGHNPPLVQEADGSVGFLAVKKGLVAGIMPDVRYPATHRILTAGEGVLLYTDGVTEAGNPADEFYGEERLLALIAGHRRNARELVEAVRADVTAFAAGAAQADDITMLALRFHAGAPATAATGAAPAPAAA